MSVKKSFQDRGESGGNPDKIELGEHGKFGDPDKSSRDDPIDNDVTDGNINQLELNLGEPRKLEHPVSDNFDNIDNISGSLVNKMELEEPKKSEEALKFEEFLKSIGLEGQLHFRDFGDCVNYISMDKPKRGFSFKTLDEPSKFGDPDCDITNGVNSNHLGNKAYEGNPNKMELEEYQKLEESSTFGDPDREKSNRGDCGPVDNDDSYGYKDKKFRFKEWKLRKARQLEKYRKLAELQKFGDQDRDKSNSGTDHFEYKKRSPFLWVFEPPGYCEQLEKTSDEPVAEGKPPVCDNLMDTSRAHVQKKRIGMEEIFPKKSKKRSLFSRIEMHCSKNDIEFEASANNMKSVFGNERRKKKSKPEKTVQFSDVTIYYFKRAQGFVSVPTQGGSTLGMELTHSHMERLSVCKHAKGRKLVLKKSLANHGRIAKYKSTASDCDDNEESDVASESELPSDTVGILKAVPIQERRALLHASGVKEIDSSEEEECRQLRKSRKLCGCKCKDACDPDSCSCSQNGIKCQVDYKDFPCKCGSDCRNSSGRIEYSEVVVKDHFMKVTSKLGNMYPKIYIDKIPLIAPEEEANLIRCEKCKDLEESGVPFPFFYADNDPEHVAFTTFLEEFFKDEYSE